MQIAIHIGANCTDDERLLASLRKNAEAMAPQGIAIPKPGKYRTRVRETIQGLGGQPPAPGTRDDILSNMGAAKARRVVLSNSQFICVVKRIFENREFYHLIDEKVPGLRAIFPEDDIHYFLALRNPASFIPAVYSEQGDYEFTQFMRKLDPMTVKWSQVIDRIRARDPDAKLTVWCDEDAPMIWARLVRDMLGVDGRTRIAGGFDMIQSLITDDGMAKMVATLRANPPRTEAAKQEVIAEMLNLHGRPEQIEQEIDVPGWGQTQIEALTTLYDQDVARIAARSDLTFIAQ